MVVVAHEEEGADGNPGVTKASSGQDSKEKEVHQHAVEKGEPFCDGADFALWEESAVTRHGLTLLSLVLRTILARWHEKFRANGKAYRLERHRGKVGTQFCYPPSSVTKSYPDYAAIEEWYYPNYTICSKRCLIETRNSKLLCQSGVLVPLWHPKLSGPRSGNL